MNASGASTSTGITSLTNGSGGAAVLAAGVGTFTLAVLTLAADQVAAIKPLMIFYKPTGPLSGVTTTALLIWLFTWGILEWRWRNRNIAMGRTSVIALILLGLSVLLTFPPVADLF